MYYLAIERSYIDFYKIKFKKWIYQKVFFAELFIWKVVSSEISLVFLEICLICIENIWSELHIWFHFSVFCIATD